MGGQHVAEKQHVAFELISFGPWRALQEFSSEFWFGDFFFSFWKTAKEKRITKSEKEFMEREKNISSFGCDSHVLLISAQPQLMLPNR